MTFGYLLWNLLSCLSVYVSPTCMSVYPYVCIHTLLKIWKSLYIIVIGLSYNGYWLYVSFVLSTLPVLSYLILKITLHVGFVIPILQMQKWNLREVMVEWRLARSHIDISGDIDPGVSASKVSRLPLWKHWGRQWGKKEDVHSGMCLSESIFKMQFNFKR